MQTKEFIEAIKDLKGTGECTVPNSYVAGGKLDDMCFMVIADKDKFKEYKAKADNEKIVGLSDLIKGLAAGKLLSPVVASLYTNDPQEIKAFLLKYFNYKE